MRTTVDLPPAVHARARALAEQRHTSLSAVIADLTVVGLRQIDEPSPIHIDPVTGLPTLTLGHRITSEQVADILDED